MNSPRPSYYVEPEQHLSPEESAIAVFGWCLMLPLVIVLVLRTLTLVRFRQAARLNAQYDPRAELLEGPIVLKGTIATEEPFAARVTIDQQGKEQKGKNSWTTHWRETGRRTEATAFRLDTPQGLVLVEADENTQMVCDIDKAETRIGKWGLRQRIMTMKSGDVVYASGELVYGLDTRAGDGYRGGNKSLVLRQTKTRPLLLSNERLGERSKRRGQTTRSWATAYLVAAVLMQLTFCMYHLRLFAGETGVATVASQRTYVTRSKNGTTTHYELTAWTADGRKFEDEVSAWDYNRIHEGTQVPVRYLSWWHGHERLGVQATVSLPHVVIWMVLVVVLAVIQIVSSRSSRPWYVVPLKESTPGRLPE